MTKEEIEDRLNGLINAICEAERECANAEGRQYRIALQDYQETRKRVMDTLIDIYIG